MPQESPRPHILAFNALNWEERGGQLCADHEEFTLVVLDTDDDKQLVELRHGNAVLARARADNQGTAVRSLLKRALAVFVGARGERCVDCDSVRYRNRKDVERCLNPACERYRE